MFRSSPACLFSSGLDGDRGVLEFEN
jgi:hypothetical protein